MVRIDLAQQLYDEVCRRRGKPLRRVESVRAKQNGDAAACELVLDDGSTQEVVGHAARLILGIAKV